MRDYFVYDGVSSADFNAYVATSNFFASPAESVKRESVPGRNGDVFISNNRYENLKLEVMTYIPENVVDNMKHLREHLMSRKNYCRYEESMNPDYFRMARFLGPFEPDPIDRWRGGVELTFDCKPQMFLRSGAEFSMYDGDDYPDGFALYNPFQFTAHPIIQAHGIGSITINGSTVEVLSMPDLPDHSPMPYVIIDCERKDCYYSWPGGFVNMNNYVSISNDFPELPAGESEVAFTNSLIEIAPMWWTI